MAADNTLDALRKLKVDCLYNKSTHFNAAYRLKKASNLFRTALIIGSILATFSTIMNVGLWDKIQGDTTVIQVIVNILGAVGGFLIMYTTTFSDYKAKIDMAYKHENIGSELNQTFKKIRNTEASFLDGLIKEDELKSNLEELTDTYSVLCKSAPITEPEDYNKAKTDFTEGNLTTYTEQELNA